MDWNDQAGWGSGWGWLMVVMMIVMVAAVVVAVVWLVRVTPGGGQPSLPAADDAERILDQRFARGEIDNDEYTSRRDLLRRR
jgi:putative membrane protein